MKKWLIGCALFLNSSAWASHIHTLTLQHQLAIDLLPQIQPFLPTEATILANGNKLILKSDRKTLTEVEILLKTLDIPAHTLTITILRTNQSLPENSTKKVWSTHQTNDNNQQYQLRAIDGKPVDITISKTVPKKHYLLFTQSYSGIGVTQKTDYISVQNGFYAIPFVLPQQRIRVEIHPFSGNLSGSSHTHIEQSQIVTTIEGELGEWLELARITNDVEYSAEESIRYRSRANTNQFMYLKVESSN